MKLLRDTWLVLQRQLTQTLRNPVWLVMGLLQPVYYLALFAPLLRGALDLESMADAYLLFIPGILVMLTIFVTAFAGFGLLAEVRAGVVERSLVTPVSRAALLFGRCLRDVVGLLAQGMLIVVLAFPFGLSAHLGGVLLTFAVLALLAVTLASLSYGAALRLRNEDALGSLVNVVSQPVVLLSGILLPLTFAPDWLRAIANANPITWAVDASRALYVGDLGNPDVLWALMTLTVLMTLSLLWAGRAFGRAAR